MNGTRLQRFLSLLSFATMLILPTAPGQAATTANWAAYMFNSGHGSFNAAATSITTTSASTLAQYWRWSAAPATQSGQPGPGLLATPVLYGGRIYIGANTGVFYALDPVTKTVVWSKFLGYVPNLGCGARGITSTATVAPDPSRSGQLTVYVAGGDGYLYALRASDGAQVWRAVVAIPSTTTNDYYDWGSPAVRHGKVYMGISSECDMPLVRGGVKGYQQANGALIGTYYTVPSGATGGSVWSSVAVNAGGDVFATTGNGTTGDSFSIVRLNGTTMARIEAWQVPAAQRGADDDFGGSPTLFSATINGTTVPMVGACNKNGFYYALRQQNLAAGPVWQLRVGDPTAKQQCVAGAPWDGSRLFIGGPPTSIGGTQFNGSIRRVNPATGAVIWARGLNQAVLGSPTLNGSGVLAAGTYTSGVSNAVYLMNSTTGQLLRTIDLGSAEIFAQPVFADSYLLMATIGAGLMIYR